MRGAPGSSAAKNEEMASGYQGAVLAYDGVGIACGDRMVVEGASFSVGAGRIVGLVGESGSGKTTLLKAAMGLLDDDMRLQTGRVLYQGEDVAGMSASRLRELRG